MFAPNEDQWRKTLREAADLLRKDGWCQWDFQNPVGERCLMGALRDVSEIWYTSPAYKKARKLLMERVGANPALRSIQMVTPIAAWNDTPGRTKEEVINLLESVANEYE